MKPAWNWLLFKQILFITFHFWTNLCVVFKKSHQLDAAFNQWKIVAVTREGISVKILNLHLIEPPKSIEGNIADSKKRCNFFRDTDNRILISFKKPLASVFCYVNFLPIKRKTHFDSFHFQNIPAASLNSAWLKKVFFLNRIKRNVKYFHSRERWHLLMLWRRRVYPCSAPVQKNICFAFDNWQLNLRHATLRWLLMDILEI